MAEWTTPKTDRDKSSINETSDLDRIENNSEVISKILNTSVLKGPDTWLGKLYIPKSEMRRIVDNVRDLRNMYYVHSLAPDLPEVPYFYWNKFNAIEENQRLLYETKTMNNRSRVYTSEIYAGNQIGVI